MTNVVICPTVTAVEPHQYRAQIERVEPFAQRIHIDLMDGEFAPTQSPPLDQIWLPEKLICDVHLMYQRPREVLHHLIKLQPQLVIIHLEADANHEYFASQLHEQNIKVGLAILQSTSAESAFSVLESFDHVLVFSGDLGKHGGAADLSLLDKVREIRQKYPQIEIAWDGGINDQNAQELVDAGVTVLNVGGFIQDAAEPEKQYQKLAELHS